MLYRKLSCSHYKEQDTSRILTSSPGSIISTCFFTISKYLQGWISTDSILITGVCVGSTINLKIKMYKDLLSKCLVQVFPIFPNTKIGQIMKDQAILDIHATEHQILKADRAGLATQELPKEIFKIQNPGPHTKHTNDNLNSSLGVSIV